MPKLETALYEYLTADPVILGLVNTRVYPAPLPEGVTLPAVTWHRVSASRLYTYDSFDDTDAWTRARIQFNAWGRDALEAMQVGDAILAALSGYGGDMSGQLIGSSFAVDEFDIYDVPTKFHRRVLDFIISYEDDVDVTPADGIATPDVVGGSAGV